MVVKALHEKQISVHGGTSGMQDESLLESALAKPMQQWNYGSPPPDTCAIAAAYAFGIDKNHAFLDGNKRTAHMVYRLFLIKNGLELTAPREDKYLHMIRLASGDHTQESFADWLRSVTRETPI